MQISRRGQAADDADGDSDGDHVLILTALPDPLLVHSLNYLGTQEGLIHMSVVSKLFNTIPCYL
jgi:hypothetical protein